MAWTVKRLDPDSATLVVGQNDGYCTYGLDSSYQPKLIFTENRAKAGECKDRKYEVSYTDANGCSGSTEVVLPCCEKAEMPSYGSYYTCTVIANGNSEPVILPGSYSKYMHKDDYNWNIQFTEIRATDDTPSCDNTYGGSIAGAVIGGSNISVEYHNIQNYSIEQTLLGWRITGDGVVINANINGIDVTRNEINTFMISIKYKDVKLGVGATEDDYDKKGDFTLTLQCDTSAS